MVSNDDYIFNILLLRNDLAERVRQHPKLRQELTQLQNQYHNREDDSDLAGWAQKFMNFDKKLDNLDSPPPPSTLSSSAAAHSARNYVHLKLASDQFITEVESKIGKKLLPADINTLQQRIDGKIASQKDTLSQAPDIRSAAHKIMLEEIAEYANVTGNPKKEFMKLQPTGSIKSNAPIRIKSDDSFDDDIPAGSVIKSTTWDDEDLSPSDIESDIKEYNKIQAEQYLGKDDHVIDNLVTRAMSKTREAPSKEELSGLRAHIMKAFEDSKKIIAPKVVEFFALAATRNYLEQKQLI